MKDLTKNRWKFVLIPALIVIAGIVLYIVHGGFNFDVEFMGGIRMQVNMHTDFDNKEVADLIQEKTVDTVSAKVQTGDNPQVAVIKTPPVDETVKTEIFNALKDKYNLSDDDLLSVSSASASFGNEIQRKALLYTLLAIICILIYIAIRFEWRSAIMAVIALAINVLIMAAIYAITNIPLNTNFIAAMLTVVGYSINNTIVIFDRIRENTKSRKKNETISEMVNRSVFETMGRTINSTITTLITIVLIYILGVSAIKEFALPLIVGILAGAYTVIFLPYFKNTICFFYFYYVSLNNFFLTIAYAINTAIPVIIHETGYTFISISKLLNLLNTVYIHINLNTHDPNTVSTAGVIEYPNPLNAAPPISYELAKHSNNNTWTILIDAYSRTALSVV